VSEDRIVMYIVIPKSLKMSIGKVGATCGHATQLLMQMYAQRIPIPSSSDWSSSIHETNVKACETFDAWLQSSYAKIVLGASVTDFAEVRELPGSVVVVDIGLKEVSPGSVTAVGLWPMLKSAAPAIIRKLEPLR
jgi:peptidyl-tRNA hydrolase